ncbi:hypothetical protein D0B32_23305 [Paraburkholderia sp. DHOC27]|nr:hypothetical protein D0B32_23305 [Paraburkholderia sp. DHOC27]
MIGNAVLGGAGLNGTRVSTRGRLDKNGNGNDSDSNYDGTTMRQTLRRRGTTLNRRDTRIRLHLFRIPM